MRDDYGVLGDIAHVVYGILTSLAPPHLSVLMFGGFMIYQYLDEITDILRRTAGLWRKRRYREVSHIKVDVMEYLSGIGVGVLLRIVLTLSGVNV